VGNLPYLWRINADGVGDPERLEIAGVNASWPALSPAANRLAFMRLNSNRDIWRYKADGSHEVLITSSLAEVSPQFSPNGEKIAFGSSRSGEAFEIWVANADGSHPVQLTNKIGRFQGSPRWSPDGRWITFDSQPPDGKQDIYVIDATGGRPRRLDLGPYQNALPSWSRDGKWIYYLSDRTGRHEIWRVHPTGGNPEQITDNGGHNALESVDGKTLFYAKENTGTPIFARSLAGGPERKIIDFNGLTRDFLVFEDGIYYGGRPDEKGSVPLLFYQFSTGANRLITSLGNYVFIGLTVSPDRKTFLYTRSMSLGGDLMMIENFR
jgi:Tol biopolymer transport system component